jgi:hypothetical protein
MRSGASHFAVALRPPRLRLSGPANQRFVSISPSRRRSLSRRSAFLRNLHEHSIGMVHASKGRRGAARSKTRLPEARVAAAQHKMLGAIETARKSPPVFGCLVIAIGVCFFAVQSRGVLPNSSFNSLIMIVNNPFFFPCAVDVMVSHCHQEQCHRQALIVEKHVRALRWVPHRRPY